MMSWTQSRISGTSWRGAKIHSGVSGPMSGSNRGFIAPAIGVVVGALAIALVVGVVWSLSSIHTEREVEAAYAARDYAETADRQIGEDCARLQSPSREQCIAQAIQATREAQRGEHDLVAQETVATWTGFMAAIAALGLFASFAGIGLVYVTFRETRRVGEAQVRAYMVAQQPALASYEGQAYLIVAVSNSGQSPARQAVLVIHPKFITPGGDGRDSRAAFKAIFNDVPSGVTTAQKSVPMDFNVADFEQGKLQVNIDLCIEYFDVFGRKHSDRSEYWGGPVKRSIQQPVGLSLVPDNVTDRFAWSGESKRRANEA